MRGDCLHAAGTAILRRGVYPVSEVRDSLLARLLWCSWYQDLSEARPVRTTSATARKEDMCALLDAELRAVALRAARIAVIVPVTMCGVLWFASDRPFQEVFFTSTVPRVWFSGMLFSQVLEVLDIAYTLPPLLFVEPPMKVPGSMNQPFAANSLGEFWSLKWNNAIQTILYHSVHRPVKEATSSGGVAALATFFSSALFHVYGVAIAGASHSESSMVMAFFIAQAVFVNAEWHVLRALSRRGHETAMWGRVFMWAGIVLPGCLFYVPVLRLAGVGWT